MPAVRTYRFELPDTEAMTVADSSRSAEVMYDEAARMNVITVANVPAFENVTIEMK
jgi:hypothetical protein